MKTQIPKTTHPYYKHIYNYLSEEISEGKLSAGDKVLSEKELCAKFGVSRITSKKALEMLNEHGLIFRIPGKGSFVSGSTSYKTTRVSPSHIVGLVVADFNDAFGTRLLNSIEGTCEALGYHLLLKFSHDSVREEEKALRSISNDNITGILVLPAHGEYYNPEILKQILDKKPLVFVDRKMKGLPVPTVSTDNAGIARDVVNYLLNLGHRNIAFYSGPMENVSTVEDRWNGFINAFNDLGLLFDSSYLCLDVPETDGVETVKRHMEAYPEITAAFATEFSKALIVRAAAEALGRRIPDDFSIITVDCPVFNLETPRFTFMRQDEDTIGRRAVETLHSIISGADPAGLDDIWVPAQMVKGSSTGPLTSTIPITIDDIEEDEENHDEHIKKHPFPVEYPVGRIAREGDGRGRGNVALFGESGYPPESHKMVEQHL
jgi:DNA-binding LacI/PurR family transcriptional regulator